MKKAKLRELLKKMQEGKLEIAEDTSKAKKIKVSAIKPKKGEK